MVKPSMLADDEQVVFRAHAHWKRLVVPVLVTLVVAAAVTLLLVSVMDDAEPWARWAVVGVGVVVVARLGLWPTLVWASSTDVLTTRRLISRRGVVSREGRDIPIDRVHSVSYRRSLLDRLLGCGTLVVRTAGDESDVELDDVARIERRILQIQEVMLGREIPAEGEPPLGRA